VEEGEQGTWGSGKGLTEMRDWGRLRNARHPLASACRPDSGAFPSIHPCSLALATAFTHRKGWDRRTHVPFEGAASD